VVHRRSALAAVLARVALLAAIVAACSVAPASGSPGAAAPGASSTPTPNPNQLAEQRRSLAITPEPTPASGPTGSPPPQPTSSPYAPDLEAILPSTVRGVLLQHYSAPASLYDVGGDICFLLCPGEPSRLANAAGVPVQALTVGVAFPPQNASLRVAVIAIRFDGLDAKRSPVDVRIKAGGHVASAAEAGLVPTTTPLKVGSRAVSWVTWPPFYQPEQGEYLLASGNVLFIVAGLPPAKDGTVPDDVRLMIEALP
jgi:hypothetical protein